MLYNKPLDTRPVSSTAGVYSYTSTKSNFKLEKPKKDSRILSSIKPFRLKENNPYLEKSSNWSKSRDSHPNSSSSGFMFPKISSYSSSKPRQNQMSKSSNDVHMTMDKEKLFEEYLKAKSTINQLTRELVQCRYDNKKYQNEILRQNKQIENFLDSQKNNFEFGREKNPNYDPVKETRLIANLKFEFIEMKKLLRARDSQIQELKMNMKSSRSHEIAIERDILQKEVLRQKDIISSLFEKQELSEKRYKELLETKQRMIIQENEMIKLKQQIKDYKQKNEELSKRVEADEISSLKLIKELDQKLKDPEYLHSNKINKQIIINSYFNSKMEQLKIDLERLESQNNTLKEVMIDIFNGNPIIRSTYIGTVESILGTDKMFDDNKYLKGEALINEFTYFLIKNFEARNLTGKFIRENILAKTTKEGIIESMIDVLNPNQIDKEKIKEYINTISSLCESNITAMKNKLNFIFESIVHYDEGYIKKIRPKLYKKLLDHKDSLNKEFESNLSTETKKTKGSSIIRFSQLRNVINKLNINLKDRYVEYMIYLMKSSAIRSNINIGFDELEYKILNEFLKTPPEDFAGQEDLPSSEEENYGDDFEKELEVPYETFNTKTSEIIQKIHHYLKSNNTTLHQIFEGHIFTHNLDDANSYDAILLDNFINVLDSLGIKLEMIEKYCIFAKLCKTESIETIDFSKLCNEITSFESNEKKIEMEEIKEMNEDLTNPIDDY